ncbi:unnamed protein product [Clonostachys solani]|uniref:CBM-cenC domain-containing protein n=1 Tax=Clonostachys solani TaxID=160281 RepID=A0A9N9ZIG2_9HYPO|nr:unnamed protein product [Clonostachys solani]
MLNPLFLGSLLLLPTLGQAASIVPRQQDLCGPQPNLLLNPSWELGTSGWTYSSNVSPQIASGISSDGAQSLSISPSQYATWSVRQSAGGGTLDRSRPYTFSVDIAVASYPPYAGPLVCTFQAYHCQTVNYIFDKTVAFAPTSTPSPFVTYSGSFTPPNLVEDIVITGYCRYSTQGSPTGPFTIYIDNANFSMNAPACPTSTPVSTVPSTTPVSTPEPTTPSSTVLSATTTPSDSTTLASTTPSDSTTPSATTDVSSTPTPSDTTTPTPTTLATVTTPSSTVPSGTTTSQLESLTPTSSSSTPMPTPSRPCRRRNRRTTTVI